MEQPTCYEERRGQSEWKMAYLHSFTLAVQIPTQFSVHQMFRHMFSHHTVFMRTVGALVVCVDKEVVGIPLLTSLVLQNTAQK